MTDETTQRGYPLPNPDNIARDDATRIRSAIAMINDDVTELEERNVVATETETGSVRLATTAEASAGTATDRVLTVKRTKDMITSALQAIQGAMTALQDAVTKQLTDNDAEVDQAIHDLNDSVATQLQSFTTTLAAKFDKAGGTLTGDVSLDRANGGINIRGKLGGKDRWVLQLGDGAAEGANNAGSNFNLLRYANDGTVLDTPVSINRASGSFAIKGNVTLNGTFSTTAGATFGGDSKVAARFAIGGEPVGGSQAGDVTVIRAGSPTTGVVFLGNSGARYIYWDGSSYQLGSAGAIWHAGNIQPVTSLRAVHAGDLDQSSVAQVSGGTDNFGTMCAVSGIFTSNFTGNTTYRFRYHQYATPQGWFNFN
ncbi:hypothetical protein [Bradyrhizobium sp. SZCCHNR1093]|uniref:hypothetical protein n=1 Tax=Bradyrhizobium sp. SZCCHNR1093 TaxID=3057368 RepID=UPI0028E311BF|nr:hypothetical protein [Bradyrhizobium sp. SZCCHNR1093]